MSIDETSVYRSHYGVEIGDYDGSLLVSTKEEAAELYALILAKLDEEYQPPVIRERTEAENAVCSMVTKECLRILSEEMSFARINPAFTFPAK